MNHHLEIDEIINIVCDYFEVTKEELISKSRKHPIVHYRHIAIALTRKHGKNYSLNYIAWEFGRTDHSTVLHAIKNVEDLTCTRFNNYHLDWKRLENMIAIKQSELNPQQLSA